MMNLQQPCTWRLRVGGAILVAATTAQVMGAATGPTAAELEARIGGRDAWSTKDAVYRRYALAALLEGQVDHGVGALTKLLRQTLQGCSAPTLSPSQVQGLTRLTDALFLLRFFAAAGPGAVGRADVSQWLFGDDERLALFLDTVTPLDDWPAARGIIGELYDHDPAQRDRRVALILALAVVWDQPRPALHRQMGPSPMRVETAITDRYDYFRDLYGSRAARIAYARLSPAELVFVVDTPVPVSELQWVRANVSGTASGWKSKFGDVSYDRARLERGVYQWPHGAYSLAALREHGGICVDQAYYAVMTARAYGIPAMLFAGAGVRGPHAWFGCLRDEGRWELDVGRYVYDRYATGQCVHPQTNTPMTDHDIEFTCDRALQSERLTAATTYARTGLVLGEAGDVDGALQFGRKATDLVETYEPGWRLQEAVLASRERADELLALLDRKASAFRRYPDAVVAVRRQQAAILRAVGRADEAMRLLDRSEDRVGRERDDLARTLGQAQALQAWTDGDPAEARKKLEGVLRDQREEGHKVLPLLEQYLQLTGSSGQTEEAVRFLRHYCESMHAKNSDSLQLDRNAFLEVLCQAYKQNGDDRHVSRLQRRIRQER